MAMWGRRHRGDERERLVDAEQALEEARERRGLVVALRQHAAELRKANHFLENVDAVFGGRR